MANYDIPQYPSKRLRYFNNQFLIDQDFIDDDAAQIGHERAFLRALCIAGVCEGLQVTYPTTNLPPSVSAGIAIDKAGRMIVVDHATDALVKSDALADGDYFIHISFLETEDAKASGQGAPDFTRWKQTPVVNATAKSAALPDGAVVLGSCTVQNKVFVGAGSTIGRQYSGLRLPGPNQNTTATLRNNGAADDLAVLAGSLTLRRDVRAQLGPTLTLFNNTGGAGAGGAIDFNGCDPGTNDPTLRVQSLDDGNYSSHLTFSTKQSGGNANKLVERLRLTSTGNLGIGTQAPSDILHVRHIDTVGLFESTTTGAAIRLATSEGVNNQVQFANRSGGNAAIWVGTAGDALTVKKDGGVVVSKATGGTGVLTVENCLRFPNESNKDRIILWDSFGMGLSDGNINLFYPPSAHFSLRQNSTSGAEVFSVSGSGTVKFSGPIDGSLTIRHDASGQLGPTLTLLNGSGGTNAGGAIDFNGNDPGSGNDPMLRIQSLDAGNWSSHLTFSTKKPGGPANQLVERMRLTSDGLLQFPNDTKDKLLFFAAGTDRYGLGLNDSNINVFCPTYARFSLRQNSSSGTEVFSVDGSGTAKLSGSLAVGDSVSAAGNMQVAKRLAANGALTFGNTTWDTYAADSTIVADSANYKAMMIVGSNQNQGHGRWIRMWDDVQVEGTLTVENSLKFPNTSAPTDKIVLYDGFGLGMNSQNISLFCTPGSYFSLRQSSCNGTEVFKVNGSGTVTLSGPLVPKVGNDASSGIYFPTNPGGGSGDEAFLRYYVVSGETTKLVLGINNDGDDALVLYQAGAERLTISNGTVNINNGATISGGATFNGNIYMNGIPVSLTSDAILKRDIVAHEFVLDRVIQLRPVRFKWKADGSNGSGFIAQEVEALFPDLVYEGLADEATGRRIKSIAYDRFGMLAIAAIKELKTDYDARLAMLEQRLAAQGGKS